MSINSFRPKEEENKRVAFVDYFFYAAIFCYTDPAWPTEASQPITARDDDVIL